MKRKHFFYGAISLIILVLSFVFSAYLVSSKPLPEKDEGRQTLMYVKAEPVSLTEINTEMNYRGRVTAFDQVALSAEVQGKILQGDVRFKTGESFNQGDVLLSIYKDDVVASLKSGKASLLQTLSIILPDIKVDYPDEFEKWSLFFTEIKLDKPLPDLPQNISEKEKVFLAANNVLSTYFSLQQQEINLKRYIVYAPFDGIFKNVYKEIGAIASPGVELATLLRTDKLEITVPVFPTDLKDITKGEEVKVNNDAGEVIKATVSRISGFVDESTQSVNVYLTFYPGASSGFLTGAYVDVHFNGNTLTGYEIPREAVFDGNYVYELKDKKLEKKQVEILRQLNDTYIISTRGSDEVIVTESLASINPTAEYVARK